MRARALAIRRGRHPVQGRRRVGLSDHPHATQGGRAALAGYRVSSSRRPGHTRGRFGHHGDRNSPSAQCPRPTQRDLGISRRADLGRGAGVEGCGWGRPTGRHRARLASVASEQLAISSEKSRRVQSSSPHTSCRVRRASVIRTSSPIWLGWFRGSDGCGADVSQLQAEKHRANAD